jgi:hypothetical protein
MHRSIILALLSFVVVCGITQRSSACENSENYCIKMGVNQAASPNLFEGLISKAPIWNLSCTCSGKTVSVQVDCPDGKSTYCECHDAGKPPTARCN